MSAATPRPILRMENLTDETLVVDVTMVDVTEDDFVPAGQPIKLRPITVDAELAALRTQLDTDRRAYKDVLATSTADLERTRSQLESAMRFILGDPARAKAWALRGPA